MLDDLLAELERRAAVTLVTPRTLAGVTAKPAPILACTSVTYVTPQNDNTGSEALKVGDSPEGSPESLSPAARVVVDFRLTDWPNAGGSVLGAPGDSAESLISDLRERYRGRLKSYSVRTPKCPK